MLSALMACAHASNNKKDGVATFCKWCLRCKRCPPPPAQNAPFAGEECRFYHSDEASEAWRKSNALLKRKRALQPKTSVIMAHHAAAPEEGFGKEKRFTDAGRKEGLCLD
jgi:hypothetical protein